MRDSGLLATFPMNVSFTHVRSPFSHRYRARTSKRGLQRFKRAAKLIQHAMRNRKKKTAMAAKLAIVVEEARMDKQLTTLRDKVSACSVSGRSPDENTLIEIESYVAMLRSIIAIMRVVVLIFLIQPFGSFDFYITECWIY